MGGRGSRSSGGNRAPDGYSTVGEIRGVRVIQDKKLERGYLFMDLRMEAFIGKAGVVLLSNIANMTVKDFPKKI